MAHSFMENKKKLISLLIAVKPIVFCDFDGTICHDLYWRSLPDNQREKIQKFLFGDDTTMVQDWMIGKYTAEEVNQIVANHLGVSFDYLWNIFVSDCETMAVSMQTLEKLNALRDKYTVILITGNMDSFDRFTLPKLGLEKYFDHISNSYFEGKQKTTNNGELFMEYAKKYEANIKSCIVLDNSLKVCDVFKNLGGRSCLVGKEKDVDVYLIGPTHSTPL